MDSLRDRLKAIKDASDNGSHTGSGSDIDDPCNAERSSPRGQSKGSLRKYSKDEEEEKDFESDTSSEVLEHGASELSSISFGSLMKAQASLGKRKRSNNDDGPQRIHGSSQTNKAPSGFFCDETQGRRAGKDNTHVTSRTSKHAPIELSSKKAVSRKREVVAMQKVNHRDPRFEPISGSVDEQRTKKNYSFLETYRDSEMSEIKSAISKTNDSQGKEELRRLFLAMESRKKAQDVKEQQQEVLRKHRKQEKEKIGRGKRPFFLKKADQKRLALVERFEGMKSRQVDKVIERRRRKKAAREGKVMPNSRRV